MEERKDRTLDSSADVLPELKQRLQLYKAGGSYEDLCDVLSLTHSKINLQKSVRIQIERAFVIFLAAFFCNSLRAEVLRIC